jgi:hypothetical protein
MCLGTSWVPSKSLFYETPWHQVEESPCISLAANPMSFAFATGVNVKMLMIRPFYRFHAWESLFYETRGTKLGDPLHAAQYEESVLRFFGRVNGKISISRPLLFCHEGGPWKRSVCRSPGSLRPQVASRWLEAALLLH